ncbi:MAG: ATP-binding protein, partial [Elusimicrobia bacterium]|nr:ATP-binding protein [Elusimicrobiota bacterium]
FGGEINVSPEKVLGAFAEVEKLGWLVYVQAAISEVERPLGMMISKTFRLMVLIVVLVLILSYGVSSAVSKPVEILRSAAIRISKGSYEELPHFDASNDEIGELSRAFSTMSKSLKSKTTELVNAKHELERLNRMLESKVEARTRELKSAQDELIKKERLAAIGQMASIVSHEIRNPLAVISNSIYYIKTKPGPAPAEPKVTKHISMIEEEVKQADAIIDEILGFARTRELILSKVNVDDYVKEILISYPFPAHIEVAKNFSCGVALVEIDTEEMRQAIRNIIGNSIEVMPDKGAVNVETLLAGGSACIKIADSGPGIKKDILDRIFTPFFTTKARGTGLGLAIVKKAVERHRGKIEVFSEEGKGATFIISIPLVKNSVSAPAEISAKTSVKSNTAG